MEKENKNIIFVKAEDIFGKQKENEKIDETKCYYCGKELKDDKIKNDIEQLTCLSCYAKETRVLLDHRKTIFKDLHAILEKYEGK